MTEDLFHFDLSSVRSARRLEIFEQFNPLMGDKAIDEYTVAKLFAKKSIFVWLFSHRACH